MIKYEGVEKQYLYDKQKLENIIKILESGKYDLEENCTQENISVLVDEVNSFVSSITPVGKKVMLEKHETEEEAREYFGPEFIEKFDRLMTILDKQETVVALHGTEIETCPLICEKGLQYKNPSLFATTIRTDMAFGQNDIHYKYYERLLNWPHDEKKGIVIVAVPYECYYKEGIWNNHKNTETGGMGGQDYRIDPDFIVGYLDIKNKSIVLNPKYNRQHNYDGYIKDSDIFQENRDMNNMSFAQNMIVKAQKNLLEEKEININDGFIPKEREVDPTQIPYLLESMKGIFAAILTYSDGMNERLYENFVDELASSFRPVRQAVRLLKTNEQVRLEKEEQERKMAESYKNSNTQEDFDWEQWDNVEWEDALEQEHESGKVL